MSGGIGSWGLGFYLSSSLWLQIGAAQLTNPKVGKNMGAGGTGPTGTGEAGEGSCELRAGTVGRVKWGPRVV